MLQKVDSLSKLVERIEQKSVGTSLRKLIGEANSLDFDNIGGQSLSYSTTPLGKMIDKEARTEMSKMLNPYPYGNSTLLEQITRPIGPISRSILKFVELLTDYHRELDIKVSEVDEDKEYIAFETEDGYKVAVQLTENDPRSRVYEATFVTPQGLTFHVQKPDNVDFTSDPRNVSSNIFELNSNGSEITSNVINFIANNIREGQPYTELGVSDESMIDELPPLLEEFFS